MAREYAGRWERELKSQLTEMYERWARWRREDEEAIAEMNGYMAGK